MDSVIENRDSRKPSQPIPEFVDLEVFDIAKLPPPYDHRYRNLAAIYDHARPAIARAIASWTKRGGSIAWLAIEIDIVRDPDDPTSHRQDEVFARAASEPHEPDHVPVTVLLRLPGNIWEETFTHWGKAGDDA